MENQFEQYEHHGRKVWVRSSLKGKHRQHCLCYDCKKFSCGEPEQNCPIANLNYAVDIAHDLVTPVYECPEFVEGENYFAKQAEQPAP